ncbi:putative DNA modification/repair radical SAM protein [Sinanaerobacter chloroacetimidivorans]|uniref:Putative DNA modification/repair radical SAM protein n=1 Tax=Sinanaerobacter chloroacetimidivorans TaxID=2818044 RepID=A0A8J7W076_9FIRM|nr:putative DNA modification/repair radical SAM protein [Sinanaerobacter chloroacetimidivorans]MBR0597949.1 putative DNA modification/repair radical SAM protein [Sinanaerobacter chloroacetimidivorans]
MNNTFDKLKILADGAKYDVSCSSSGVERSNNGKIGSSAAAGICHSWSADGRCISLLKILFTNNCVYDCEYCVNRRSADVARASFEPDELAKLTIEFYRRNYIEGLFLSSAVEVSPDHTAERIMKCLKLLRDEYGFSGYVHAKIIPGVSPEILHQIGLLADRVSVNIELPTKESLNLLAPQKKPKGIFTPMKQITQTLTERRQLKGAGTMFKNQDIYQMTDLNYLSPEGENVTAGDGGLMDLNGNLPIKKEVRKKGKERFVPAGQTTQMIIGASPESDRQIVKISESLYRTFKMKRVYFSAYIPVSNSPLLPTPFTAPPLVREHRLYQADWLLRFYGFTADEILDEKTPFLDLEMDPKIAWALRNIEKFPMEINKVSADDLLRIPGIGATSAMRIVRQRKMAAVKFDDLKKIGVVTKRARYFITCCGRYYGGNDIAPEWIKKEISLSDSAIRNKLLPPEPQVQLSMFQPEGFRLANTMHQGGLLHD